MSDNDSSDSSFAVKSDGNEDDNSDSNFSSVDENDDDDSDSDDEGLVFKSPQRNHDQKKRPMIFGNESDSDDNEKPPPSKKKKLKKNRPSLNDENDNENNKGAGGSNNNTKPMFMETLPMDLIENRIWSYLTIDDFYCFGYSSQAMKEYVQKYAKRQGKLETNDNIHKRKWLCIDCNCNLFSVKRRIYRKKKNIPKDEKSKKIYEMLAPFSCNCKCGGDEDDDPNCRWLCYDCSGEHECGICQEEITNYCKECLFLSQCERCESYVCSNCFDTDTRVCSYPYCGRRYCGHCPGCKYDDHHEPQDDD